MEVHVMHGFLLLLSIAVFSAPIGAVKQSYIVYLGTQLHGPNPSLNEIKTVTTSHYDLLSSYLGSYDKAKEAIFYSYTRHINGFAAILDEEEASRIADHPNVVSVFSNKGRQLHTTHSWGFLGLENKGGAVPPGSAWAKARYGEDTIIGNLDTGVWPESKSFTDEGMGPIPGRWRGSCQSRMEEAFQCNRKLIGAKYFNKGYVAFMKTNNMTISPELNATFFSARDHQGHGTHTLSTAGGSFVPGASVFGNGNGTAKGGSPRARVATYKVCWPPAMGGECFDADIMAGIDAAIADGVDVLSVSLGGSPIEFFQDGISIGAFHAVKNNIVFVASAGNSGPFPGSVSNVSPWIITVGASTLDREFTSYVALGNKKHFKGASLSEGGLPAAEFYPIISGTKARRANVSATNALLCLARTLNPRKVRGKILVCLRGENARIEKSLIAAKAGAVGMILANDVDSGNDLIADPHFLPVSHLNYSDGNSVSAYLNSTKNPVAYMTRVRTRLGVKPAPFMASFSARGPNLIEETMLKPDITAPGVNIIAAFTESISPTDLDFDKRRVSFATESGTSMSCPHVAGVVGLLKTLHPDWSPAAIRSAIMTSAKTRDHSNRPLLDATMEKATPFAYGSGHIQPNRAVNPGLVYDSTTDDYLNYLCARGYNETLIALFSHSPYKCPETWNPINLNYPSITVPNLDTRPLTVMRKVKNVGKPGTYKAVIRAPGGVSVSVKPETLDFSKVGEEKAFKLVFQAKLKGRPTDFTFGSLRWSDGIHNVRSPIVVKHK